MFNVAFEPGACTEAHLPMGAARPRPITSAIVVTNTFTSGACIGEGRVLHHLPNRLACRLNISTPAKSNFPSLHSLLLLACTTPHWASQYRCMLITVSAEALSSST